MANFRQGKGFMLQIILLYSSVFTDSSCYNIKTSQLVVDQNIQTNTLPIKNLDHLKVARQNLFERKYSNSASGIKDADYISYRPNSDAKEFEIPTLNGNLKYPGRINTNKTALIFSVFNKNSGFLQCFWNCTDSMETFVLASPQQVNYVFLSATDDAVEDALWMKARFDAVIDKLSTSQRLSKRRRIAFQQQLHFVTIPVHQLGNWLPEVFRQWACLDHNCGFDQAHFESNNIFASKKSPLVVPRLDARYDWLPSVDVVFKGSTLPVAYVKESCNGKLSKYNVTGKIAMVVQNDSCSFATQIYYLQQAGAVGVVVLQKDRSIKDMHCVKSQCKLDVHIPASNVPYDDVLTQSTDLNVTFQNTPSNNFFMAIDQHGRLQEVGWFLYPSMQFLAWQAQWFDYRSRLEANLSRAAMVVSIFDDVIMQGAAGVSRSISLPTYQELIQYERVELDMALGCPGSMDHDCPHWDHTVSLSVCVVNGTCHEIGRWISSFRRRIGRWLTDITDLLPLLTGPRVGKAVTFTMKTAAWAMPWKPTLNLRFSGQRKSGDLYPAAVKPLYNGDGFKFDKHYNSLFHPINFTVPLACKKVAVFAVITGHGSDENGCGEFCVTSHVFTVNGKNHSITFDKAGSPLGCAMQVPMGSEPNEHGTWLYGRDGWCDGQNVRPWITDVTHDVRIVTSPSRVMDSNRSMLKTVRDSAAASVNSVHYQGYFNGSDPNPKKTPGIMIVASYLVFYDTL